MNTVSAWALVNNSNQVAKRAKWLLICGPFPIYFLKCELWRLYVTSHSTFGTGFLATVKSPYKVLNMSDQVATYPNLRSEHLKILPNLSNRILYQEIPTTIPSLSSDEKANFLNIILKCFVPDISNEETKFHISFLDNEEAPEAIKAVSPHFSWVKRNQYSLLALMNFIPDLCS